MCINIQFCLKYSLGPMAIDYQLKKFMYDRNVHSHKHIKDSFNFEKMINKKFV